MNKTIDTSITVKALKDAQSKIAARRPPGSSDPENQHYDHDAFMWDYYQNAIDSLSKLRAPLADAAPEANTGKTVLLENHAVSAPQASEAVHREAGLWLAIGTVEELALQYRLKYDTEGCNSYSEGGADALDAAEAAIRALLMGSAALAAQPGAQKAKA